MVPVTTSSSSCSMAALETRPPPPPPPTPSSASLPQPLRTPSLGVLNAIPLGRGPSKVVGQRLRKGKEGREETWRQRGTPGVLPDRASHQAFPAPSVKGSMGGKAESALWPQLSQGLALKSALGLWEWPSSSTPPTLSAFRVPSQRSKTQAGVQGGRGDSLCA